MNIAEYLRKKGIHTVDSSFYRDIELWKSWYDANVRGFSTYRVYTGAGCHVKRRRKSLGMAKKLCEDMADLLLNERVKITLAGKKEQDFLDQTLKKNSFLVKANEYQERKAFTGTAAYLPSIRNMERTGTGEVTGGRIHMDYVSGGDIYPVSWSNGRVTECVFAFRKTYCRKKYIHLQYHMLEHGKYVIRNTILEHILGSHEGRELAQEEWNSIPVFSGVPEQILTGSDRPQFVIDRLNIANNADEDNPMGIAIFANAIDVLKELDIIFDSYSNEFELGRKRIFVAPEMIKSRNGNPAFDPEDTVFYTLPDDYAEKDDKGMIHEVDLSLRTEEHGKALQDGLNYLSMKCGFGQNRYQFDAGSGQVKTATEVVSENSDMFRMLKKHEIILEEVLKDLAGIILRLGNVLGMGLDDEVEATIDFDDSIIEDRQAERDRDRADVAMGAMPLWEYRMKWYHEDETKAKAMVEIQEEVMDEG